MSMNINTTNTTVVAAPSAPGPNLLLYLVVGFGVTFSLVVFSALVVRFCNRD